MSSIPTLPVGGGEKLLINADMHRRCYVYTAAQPWVESPSRQVLRKRVHLAGGAESGQVTSLVRYQPGASFSRHEHPQGEEILVLEGIFSDEHGDWPAGTWLLNPEGFTHQPFSKAGCLLLVKLRQYTGQRQASTNWPSLPLTKPPADGYPERRLDDYAGVQTSILELPPEATLTEHFTGGVEGFVVTGSLSLGTVKLMEHDWFRLPPGDTLSLLSNGCTLYLKSNDVNKLIHEPHQAAETQ
jgi:hypothetical protein